MSEAELELGWSSHRHKHITGAIFDRSSTKYRQVYLIRACSLCATQSQRGHIAGHWRMSHSRSPRTYVCTVKLEYQHFNGQQNVELARAEAEQHSHKWVRYAYASSGASFSAPHEIWRPALRVLLAWPSRLPCGRQTTVVPRHILL